jgi:hypothetical protein
LALTSAFFAFLVAFCAASRAFLAETSASVADFFAAFVADRFDMAERVPEWVARKPDEHTEPAGPGRCVAVG